MKRLVEGEDRQQGVLRPGYLDDHVAEDNPVSVVEAFIDELDLGAIAFVGVQPAATGRSAYHPSTLLKIYSTATSIGCSPAVAWSGRRSAISS